MTVSIRLLWISYIVFMLLLLHVYSRNEELGGTGREQLPLNTILSLLVVALAIVNFDTINKAAPQNVLVYIIIIYVLTTAIWATDPLLVVKTSTMLLAVAFITQLIAIGSINNQRLLFNILSKFLLVLVAICIFLAEKHPTIGIDRLTFSHPRWIGITDHPNLLGSLSALSIWTNSAFLLYSRSLKDILFAVAGVIGGFICIAGADSITAMIASIACVVAIVVLYLSNRIGTVTRVLLFMFGSILLLGMVIIMLPDIDLLEFLFSSTGRSSNLTGRTKVWENAMHAFGQSPVWGFGFDKLAGLSKNYRMEMSHIHNGYIEVLLKGGVLGFAIFICILLTAFFKWNRLNIIDQKSYVVYGAAAVMVLTHNMAQSSFLRGFDPIWIVFMFSWFSIVQIDKFANRGRVKRILRAKRSPLKI